MRHFVVTDPTELNRFRGKVVGNGHCVPFVQVAVDCPRTSEWRRGDLVRGQDDKIERGTVIATFHPDTKRYENDTKGRSHAAIFLGENAQGLHVMDQWVGHPVAERVIRFKKGAQPHADDGDHYYVVEAET